MTVPDVPANQSQVQANVEQQGGYLDDGVNQDLIIGRNWYDLEDLDGSGEVQGETTGEDGAADAPRLRFRTPEASNTQGEDAGLGELHGNLILTIMTTQPQMVNSSLTDARNSFQIPNGYDSANLMYALQVQMWMKPTCQTSSHKPLLRSCAFGLLICRL